jgi:hypothetical protein
VVVALVGVLHLQTVILADQAVVQVLEHQLLEQEHQDKVIPVPAQTLDHMPPQVVVVPAEQALLEIQLLLSQAQVVLDIHGHILD